jgi:CheY-like chemotaxis protein
MSEEIPRIATDPMGLNAQWAGTPDALAGRTDQRHHVLIVDDNPDTRWLLRDVVGSTNHRVETCASGEAALKAMLHGPRPDLVITDLMMPGVSGFDLRAEMLRRPELAAIPVIIISAYWARSPETLDAVAVLGKPLNLDRLLETVARALGPESRPPEVAVAETAAALAAE